MRTGSRIGCLSLGCLAMSATAPLYADSTFPIAFFYFLALGFAALAGYRRPRKWFILAAVLASLLLLFVTFVYRTPK